MLQSSIPVELESLPEMMATLARPRFSLLGMEGDELEDLLDEKLEETNIDSVSEVEDIYPASPIQEAIQLSKMSLSGPDYNVVATILIQPVQESVTVDVELVRQSWRKVVDRHPILRTILSESLDYDRFCDQIVLSRYIPDIRDSPSLDECSDMVEFSDNRPANCLILTTCGRDVLCRLHIDHTLTDGVSVAIAMRDLANAYAGIFPTSPKASYSNYIAFLQNEDKETHLSYWKKRLEGAQPCLFPGSPSASLGHASSTQVTTLVPGIRSSLLVAFCRKLNITMFSLVQTAWALVLRTYTGMDDVSFGYVTAGRDLPITHVNEIMGPLINTLICRTRVSDAKTMSGVLKDMQKHFLESLDHQTTSLGSIYEALETNTRQLFNTAVIFRPLHLDTIKNDAVSLTLVGRKSYTEVGHKHPSPSTETGF